MNSVMPNRFSFTNLSIQKRLSLFICLLVLGVIFFFGYTSYLALQSAALESGRERLFALTEQISSMFQQSGSFLLNQEKRTANQPAIKTFLISKGADSVSEARQILNNAKTDTLIPVVELYDIKGNKVLTSDKKNSVP